MKFFNLKNCLEYIIIILLLPDGNEETRRNILY